MGFITALTMKVLMVCRLILVCVLPLKISTLFDDQTLNATCNSHCECKSTVFEPVCSDGITYFSPCRAGCDKYFLNGDRDVSVSIIIINISVCIQVKYFGST